MWDNHGVSVDQALEAIADVDAALFDPDPKSRSTKAHACLAIRRAVSASWP